MSGSSGGVDYIVQLPNGHSGTRVTGGFLCGNNTDRLCF